MLCIVKVGEPVGVEAFVAQRSIEALDEGVLHGPLRVDEIELDLSLEGPLVEVMRPELRAVVQAQRSWLCARSIDELVQCVSDSCPLHVEGDLDPHTLSAEDFDSCERTKPATAHQRVLDEVDRPSLVALQGGALRAARHRNELLLTLDAHLKALFAVEPLDPLVVHLPAFPP